MPSIKDILIQQVSPIMALEGKLPSFAPKLSGALLSIAQAVPSINLPDLPGKPNEAIPKAVARAISAIPIPRMGGAPPVGQNHWQSGSPIALGTYRRTANLTANLPSVNGGYRPS